MDAVLKVGQYLIDNAEKIVREMISIALENVESELPITEEMLETSIKYNVEFLMLLAGSFNESDEDAAKALVEWSKKAGQQQAAAFAHFSSLYSGDKRRRP